MSDLSAVATETLTVPASVDEAYALVADVPRSTAHVVGLEQIRHRGEQDWTWTLEKLGMASVSLQAVYTCRYTLDPVARVVRWSAAGLQGDNGSVEGRWTVTPHGSGARLVLENRLTLHLGARIPRLMRGAAEKLVARENSRLVGLYVANIQQTLSGGDGRVRR